MVESKQDPKRRVVSFRFSLDETARINAIVKRAKQRSGGYATVAGIVKELAGIVPMSVVTENDRRFLIGLGKQKPEAKRGARRRG